jgi:hypothetical protein
MYFHRNLNYLMLNLIRKVLFQVVWQKNYMCNLNHRNINISMMLSELILKTILS